MARQCIALLKKVLILLNRLPDATKVLSSMPLAAFELVANGRGRGRGRDTEGSASE
ncbi:unnamed protein product [Camellia sinensis]